MAVKSQDLDCDHVSKNKNKIGIILLIKKKNLNMLIKAIKILLRQSAKGFLI